MHRPAAEDFECAWGCVGGSQPEMLDNTGHRVRNNEGGYQSKPQIKMGSPEFVETGQNHST